MPDDENRTREPPRVYLAGPEVFLPDAIDLGKKKKAICTKHGFEGVFPRDKEPEIKDAESQEYAAEVFEICIELMESCDLMIANMTPFRGASMDVGTAVEIGYMFHHGKPIFGYSSVPENYRDRITAAGLGHPGEIVENFRFPDNLMCVMPIRRSGSNVARWPEPSEIPPPDFDPFKECVMNAAEVYGLPLR